MYATDDVIPEMDADMMRITQASNKKPAEYAEALWNKVLRGDRDYDEYVLQDIFIEGLPESVYHGTRSYYGPKKSKTIQDLAHQATSMTKLQRHSDSSESSQNT